MANSNNEERIMLLISPRLCTSRSVAKHKKHHWTKDYESQPRNIKNRLLCQNDALRGCSNTFCSVFDKHTSIQHLRRKILAYPNRLRDQKKLDQKTNSRKTPEVYILIKKRFLHETKLFLSKHLMVDILTILIRR